VAEFTIQTGMAQVSSWQMSVIRVLLVDDFARHREIIRAILRANHDLQVVGEAADGLEAVQLAERLQPDLIVLDLNLPCLNGLEAARRIRKLSPGSKIVMASEEYSDDIVQEAVRSGALGYVRKSEIVSQLIPTIEAALKGKRLLLGMPHDID
jgi:DNA-binding NarL/FixJ family response regulator